MVAPENSTKGGFNQVHDSKSQVTQEGFEDQEP
jgi:hypothetical protein